VTYNLITAGVFAAWVVVFIALGAYFALAYRMRRRNVDYLVFAVLNVSLSAYSLACAALYLAPDPARAVGPATLMTMSGILAVALSLHFALLLGRVPRHWRYAAPVYAFSALFEVACAAGRWFHVSTAHREATHFFGAEVWTVRAEVTSLASVYYGLAGASMLVTTALLAWAYARGRREALGALLGSLVLCAAGISDIASTLRVTHVMHMVPHGYVVFAFGVAYTLLVRYSLLGKELELRSHDLQRRSEELARSSKQLVEVKSELVDKQQLAAIGELAAVVAHEVRNPLAIIGNAVSGLRKASIREDDRAILLSILEEESGRLNQLVGDLLSYARPITTERRRVSPVELLDRALGIARQRPGVRTELRHGELGPLFGDPSLLRQVFDNLIQNAVQAMSGGGSLNVSIVQGERAGLEGVLVTVADTGQGMTPDVQARAKVPFFTTRASGTGLGLAIVARIVEAHAGDLEIESREGAGTTVRVFLPRGSESPSTSPRARPLFESAPVYEGESAG
jgi:signal transduction histidine kinase